MPLRIAFDLDGVFADMEGALAKQAKALFGTVEENQASSDDPDRSNPDQFKLDQDDPAKTGSHTSRGQARDSPGRSASHKDHKGAEAALPNPFKAESQVGAPLVRLPITARQQRRLWNHVEAIDNFWETLDEIEPGSLGRLAALAESCRWEIIFLTRRPGSAGRIAQVQSQRWLTENGFPLPSVFVVQGSRGRIAASLALDIVVDDTPENCLDVMVDSKARAILVWRDQSEPPPSAAKRLGIGVVKSVEECLNILSKVDSSSHEGVMDRVKRLLGARGRRRGVRTEA